jgi:hypothetical protein
MVGQVESSISGRPEVVAQADLAYNPLTAEPASVDTASQKATAGIGSESAVVHSAKVAKETTNIAAELGSATRELRAAGEDFQKTLVSASMGDDAAISQMDSKLAKFVAAGQRFNTVIGEYQANLDRVAPGRSEADRTGVLGALLNNIQDNEAKFFAALNEIIAPLFSTSNNSTPADRAKIAVALLHDQAMAMPNRELAARLVALAGPFIDIFLHRHLQSLETGDERNQIEELKEKLTGVHPASDHAISMLYDDLVRWE